MRELIPSAKSLKEAEGQEWMRQRLQQRLQAQAREAGALFPLRQRQRRRLTVRTVVGEISVVVDHGREPGRGKWICTAREGAPEVRVTEGVGSERGRFVRMSCSGPR
jgi:hypothetical protein